MNVNGKEGQLKRMLMGKKGNWKGVEWAKDPYVTLIMLN